MDRGLSYFSFRFMFFHNGLVSVVITVLQYNQQGANYYFLAREKLWRDLFMKLPASLILAFSSLGHLLLCRGIFTLFLQKEILPGLILHQDQYERGSQLKQAIFPPYSFVFASVQCFICSSLEFICFPLGLCKFCSNPFQLPGCRLSKYSSNDISSPFSFPGECEFIHSFIHSGQYIKINNHSIFCLAFCISFHRPSISQTFILIIS